MTNTGRERGVRIRPVLVGVVAVWAVAVVVTLVGWFAYGEDRQPDTAVELVIGMVLPGVVAVAIAYAVVHLVNRRRVDRGRP
ncbi:hypothetical protein AB0B94_08380 [Micromonospora sp. NPDC048986]|uniref:hypothetical protein n=1 Tax=Micromonospora sp. NPDC048986 TaxID=3155644 RepID=UPI0033EC00C1